MIHLLLIGGGTAIASTLSFFRERKKDKKKVLVGKNSLTVVEQHHQDMEQRKEDVDHDLKLSTLAMGLTGVARFAYPPLLLIGVPVAIYSSFPIFIDAYKGLYEEKKLRSTIIDTIAITGGLITQFYFVTTLINVAYFIGQKIVVKTEEESNQQLLQLFNTHPRTVWIWVDDTELEVDFEEVEIGQIIVIHAGETIPFDGEVVEGLATVDQHMLTGESQPQDKTIADKVFSSTLLVGGKLFIRVEKAGKDTVVAQIGDILQNTTDYKSTVEAKGVQIANQLTVPTLCLSGLALLTLGPLSAISVTNCNFSDIIRIAVPLGVLNHLTIATEKGILIKDGRALELLAKVDTVVFDKTGTLTQEEPCVGKIYSCGDYNENQILSLAAAAEYRQKHPVARAILKAAQERNLFLEEIDEGRYEMGYGIKVELAEQTIRVGSRRFMVMEEVEIPDLEVEWAAISHAEGHTLVYLSIDNKLEGIIELHVVLRPEIPRIVKQLQERGLNLCIISGDHQQPTERLANILGIDDFFAETLPEDKAKHIETLQAQGRKVCFVGDGINDAIAMKKAQVAISLAGATTIATDTASIVFIDKNLSKLSELFELSTSIEKNMKSGFTWSILSGAMGVMGIFLFHVRMYGSLGLYLFTLTGSVGNAMSPLLGKDRVKKEPNDKTLDS